MKKPESVQVIKQRRDAALAQIAEDVPYIQFIGATFERRGDELTAILPYSNHLVGNPMLPALHGGVVGAFLEIAAQIELAWQIHWPQFEAGATGPKAIPKTIDFTIDYLRSGLPRDAYARAVVNRSGRRYASVHVEAWQDNRSKLFAQATGHFLMPPPHE